MKKIYTTLLLFTCSFGFSQATDLYISKYAEGSSNNKFLEIYNGTNADIDLSNYSLEMYANGAVSATNTHTFTSGTILTKGDVYVLRNSSSNIAAIATAADATSTVCNYNGDDAIALKKTGVVIDVIGQIGNDPGTGWAVAGITNQTVDKTLIRKTSVCSPNATAIASFGTNSTDSEWEIFPIDTTTGLGSFTGCNTSPTIQITSPSNGATVNPWTNTINVSVVNFDLNTNGTIQYVIDGGAPIYTDATSLSITPVPGASMNVSVQLVDNANQPLSPARTATSTFTFANKTIVANLAALRAGYVVNNYYEIQSSPTVTYTRTSRNQKYAQDASAGILIDDATGVLNSLSIVENDAVSGLKVQATEFNNVLQIVPTISTDVTKNASTAVIPENITVAQYTTNPESYESELIKFTNVLLTPTGGNFAANTDYTVTQGSDTTTFRTIFSEANYITTAVPTNSLDIIALGGENATTKFIVARRLDNITLQNDKFDNIPGLSLYPNPAKQTLNITSASFAEKEVVLYDALGKVALTTKVSNQPINITSLAKGLYVAKITEEGKTATRKIVVE